MLTISVDISEVLSKLTALEERQFPFATALALTRTAQKCQAEIRREMPTRFTIRNEWSERGIVVESAKKQQREWFSVVKVGDIWAYLKLQERGGLRVPINGHHYLCIPTQNIRKSRFQIIPSNMRPKALLSNPASKVFIIPPPDRPPIRGSFRLIVQRYAKGKNGLRTLYTMVRVGRVISRLGLEEISRKVASELWAKEFDAAMAEAVRTAR